MVPAKPGVTFEPGRGRRRPSSTRSPSRRASARRPSSATVAEPEFTTKDARALKIKEQVSTFTTYYPYADYRNINIGRAAELVNGTVLKPGETFSLNDMVGERTAENGFTEGFIISDGIFKEDLGGGVSQMATTTFNAMFFAGLEDVEHKPHSFYIDRYPVGREATVAWGAVDLRFQQRHAVRRPDPGPRHPGDAVDLGRRDRRRCGRRSTGTSPPRPASATTSPRPATRTLDHRGLLPQHRATAASTSTSGATSASPGRATLVRTEKMHTALHPLRHRHLQASRRRPDLDALGRAALGSGSGR